jgi:hypothetical protein
MTGREGLDVLVEAVLTPHRERDREGRPVPPPAWWDLPPAALRELHERQAEARRLEAALDPAGLSGTARAVLARIGRLG